MTHCAADAAAGEVQLRYRQGGTAATTAPRVFASIGPPSMFQQICQLQHARAGIDRYQHRPALRDARAHIIQQLLVPLRARQTRRRGGAAAAHERGRLAQLLDDLSAAVAAAQPRRAREDILAGLVPVDGVDDGLEPVLDVPDGAAEGVARVVGGDLQAVEGRREGRAQRLMGLGVLERLDQGEVAGDLFWCWGLAQEVVLARLGLGVRVGRLGEGAMGDGRGGGGRRGVEVLEEGAAQVDDGACRVDGDAREQREVLAAVGVGGQVGDGRVGEED